MFIVFDLDGTLCDLTHRLHYIQNPLGKDGGMNGKWEKDWDSFYKACVDDEPKWAIIEILKSLGKKNHIEIWSGRSDVVRKETEEWLHKHFIRKGIDYSNLRMRKDGNYTPDDKLKESWLRFLAKQDWPQLVFDDRQRVVNMWRRNGITCAQVDAWPE